MAFPGPNTLRCSAFVSCVVLLLLQTLHPAAATVFVVNNKVPGTRGGQRFNNEVGAANMRGVLQNAETFIRSAFSGTTPRTLPTVTLVIDSFNGVAAAGGSQISLSANYLADQPSGSAALKREVTGILYHEATHLWQNNNGRYGEDKIFTATIEGIADVIRIRAGFPNTSWPRTVRGGYWTDSSRATAYFFIWIEKTKKPNFVNSLNQKMVNPWNNDFFRQILGKKLADLWPEYQQTL